MTTKREREREREREKEREREREREREHKGEDLSRVQAGDLFRGQNV